MTGSGGLNMEERLLFAEKRVNMRSIRSESWLVSVWGYSEQAEEGQQPEDLLKLPFPVLL